MTAHASPMKSEKNRPATRAEAEACARSMPLDQIDPADPHIFGLGAELAYFERLRRDAPVHLTPDSQFGPFWSITRWDDIVAIDTNHVAFSSEPAIILRDPEEELPLPMLIAKDPPTHTTQRKAVNNVAHPPAIAALEPLIRQRAGDILDALPIGEEIDWVDKVSMELTAMTLATLFDIPQADRRKLTRWSDVATSSEDAGLVISKEQRKAELLECLNYFTEVWKERAASPGGSDLISMLATSEATKNMDRFEYLGNLVLLISGGNDTTRNTISGSIYALNQNPEQYERLKANHGLIPNMVSETIRWQTPIAYMRRRAKQDMEIGERVIKAGDKVAIWYVSGNRDESKIERPNDFWIERPNSRQHLSFGFGIHRCMGQRLAEVQLRVIWEEILKRFKHVEVVGEPRRVRSFFIRGYENLPVRLHA
ncbi:cytochrome P450 [Bradyrhizobium tropiciagri]|uniref:cytochrome P450 n=1 Tax=Bradyrhizobium tropiciagri TaxID=312253 RepID=UPI001BAB0307|nr:cytochrome P450 [Bradyrhizobium tropiciagri]MBR0873233.1 cytochrome P450 [Bradyrhizobium tropiciagri]